MNQVFLKGVLEELQIFKSKLFHSVMVPGKKDDLHASTLHLLKVDC